MVYPSKHGDSIAWSPLQILQLDTPRRRRSDDVMRGSVREHGVPYVRDWNFERQTPHASRGWEETPTVGYSRVAHTKFMNFVDGYTQTKLFGVLHYIVK